MIKLLWLAGIAAGLCLAQHKVEIGEINGAKFRIDVPSNWNGSLVVYCHGYNRDPVKYQETKLPPVIAVFSEQGFAVAQSGYAAGGWAIQEAATDTESLRRYFAGKYGKPKETFVTGHSMGGFLTMLLMERYPHVYDGGLALCGPLAPATHLIARAFDLRVVFDYYFPGVLPAPDKVPSDYVSTPEKTQEVLKTLESSPEKAGILRRYAAVRNDRDLAGTLSFLTYVLKEIQERAGGNPIDNRSVIYEIDGDYNALNEGVKRYAGDARAAAYLREFYTPTGKLERPLLAVHTTYDALVPARIPNLYIGIAERAGSRDLFVQQYVKHDGHCTILPPEVAKAFGALRAWKDNGTKPQGGGL